MEHNDPDVDKEQVDDHEPKHESGAVTCLVKQLHYLKDQKTNSNVVTMSYHVVIGPTWAVASEISHMYSESDKHHH